MRFEGEKAQLVRLPVLGLMGWWLKLQPNYDQISLILAEVAPAPDKFRIGVQIVRDLNRYWNFGLWIVSG